MKQKLLFLFLSFVGILGFLPAEAQTNFHGSTPLTLAQLKAAGTTGIDVYIYDASKAGDVLDYTGMLYGSGSEVKRNPSSGTEFSSDNSYVWTVTYDGTNFKFKNKGTGTYLQLANATAALSLAASSIPMTVNGVTYQSDVFSLRAYSRVSNSNITKYSPHGTAETDAPANALEITCTRASNWGTWTGYLKDPYSTAAADKDWCEENIQGIDNNATYSPALLFYEVSSTISTEQQKSYETYENSLSTFFYRLYQVAEFKYNYSTLATLFGNEMGDIKFRLEDNSSNDAFTATFNEKKVITMQLNALNNQITAPVRVFVKAAKTKVDERPTAITATTMNSSKAVDSKKLTLDGSHFYNKPNFLSEEIKRGGKTNLTFTATNGGTTEMALDELYVFNSTAKFNELIDMLGNGLDLDLTTCTADQIDAAQTKLNQAADTLGAYKRQLYLTENTDENEGYAGRTEGIYTDKATCHQAGSVSQSALNAFKTAYATYKTYSSKADWELYDVAASDLWNSAQAVRDARTALEASMIPYTPNTYVRIKNKKTGTYLTVSSVPAVSTLDNTRNDDTRTTKNTKLALGSATDANNVWYSREYDVSYRSLLNYQSQLSLTQGIYQSVWGHDGSYISFIPNTDDGTFSLAWNNSVNLISAIDGKSYAANTLSYFVKAQDANTVVNGKQVTIENISSPSTSIIAQKPTSSNVTDYDNYKWSIEYVTELPVSLGKSDDGNYYASFYTPVALKQATTGHEVYTASGTPVKDATTTANVADITLTQVTGVIPAGTLCIVKGSNANATFPIVYTQGEKQGVYSNGHTENSINPEIKDNYCFHSILGYDSYWSSEGESNVSKSNVYSFGYGSNGVYKNKLAFYHMKSPMIVKGQRLFIPRDEIDGKVFPTSSSVQALRLKFENGTTGISTITVPVEQEGSNYYFDLSGRRVLNPTQGIYIHNGKKVLVK